MAGTKKRAVVKKAAARRKAATVTAGPRFAEDVTKAVVDSVPPDGHQTNAKRLRYQTKMAEVRKKVGPGKTVLLVTYASRTTARATIRRLEAGEQPIDGKLSDWELTARRTPDGGSALYVKLKR